MDHSILPSLIYLGLIVLSAGITLSKHGEVKIERHNAWVSLLGAAIVLPLLWWGGFFDALIRTLS